MWTFWKDRFIMYVSTANFKFYYRFAKKKKRERDESSAYGLKKKHMASVMLLVRIPIQSILNQMIWTLECRQQKY